MAFDERLIEAGIELGNDAIRMKLAELGYRPTLLLKGPHDEIEFRCEKGGRGMSCTHVFEQRRWRQSGAAVPTARSRTCAKTRSRRSARPRS